MRTTSLRFRLTAWYAGILTGVVVALAAIFFLHIEKYLENTNWETQARRAHQIAETLVVNITSTGQAYFSKEIEALYAPEKSDRFIRVTRQDGYVIYLSGVPHDQMFDPAGVPPAPDSPHLEFNRKQAMQRGDALLISAVRARAEAGDFYLVEVGVSAAPDELMFQHMLWLLSLGLPIVILLAASGGYVLVRRALRPVDQISAKAEQITQHNLSERLPLANTGDELERLSIALNHMINRLDDAFQNSKRFVADASHELRTPLTILRGELEEMAQEKDLSPDHKDRLGSLLEEMERLSKIAERLFALSRLDAGEAQTEWSEFDLGELTISTAGQMELLAEDRRIELTSEAERPVLVEGDRARLKQVVVNLLDNAIKYTPDGGAIHVKVSAAGGRAVLEIADTGIGIPADALPKVFERFFRADKSRPRHPDGAGLGLAIVKSICRAHAGEVEVDSVVGRGSCFRVKLPLAKEKPTSSIE